MARIILLLLTFVVSTTLAQQPALVVQQGHTNLIKCAAFSNDNKWVATGSIDQSIRLWDVESGKLLKIFNNDDTVYDLAFYGNRYNILSGCYGIGTEPLKLWNVETDSTVNLQFGGGALNIDFSENGKYGAIASSQGYIYLWNVDSNSIVKNYDTKTKNSINNLIVSEEKGIVLATSFSIVDSNNIFIWDLNSEELIKKIHFKNGIGRLHLLEKENAILVEDKTFYGNTKVYKIDIDSEQYVDSFSLSYSVLLKDDVHLIGVNQHKNIEIINIKNHKIIKEFKTKVKEVNVMELSFDEKTLLIANKDLELYDLEKNKSKSYIDGGKWIDGLSFAANADKLAFSGKHGEIINWDLETGNVDVWEGHREFIKDIHYHKNGEVLASVSYDSTLNIYNQLGEKTAVVPFKSDRFSNITITMDGNWLAVGCEDSIYSVDATNGEISGALSFGVRPDKILYSPNEIEFAAILNRNLLVYNMAKDSFSVLFESSGGLEDLAFSTDGSFVAVGGYNDNLDVISVKDNSVFFTLPNNGDYVASLAFNPSNFQLAVGYTSGTIKLIDLNTKEVIAEKKLHANIVNKLSYKSDGSILASASWDGKLILWDTKKLDKKAELYAFGNGDWAVIDDAGRYDASKAGNINQLHWVIDEETIALNQFKERYYEPNLLQKLLGYNSEELRDVEKLKAIQLYPRASIFERDNKFEVWIQERNGGVGRVQLFINNKEVETDISEKLELSKDSLLFTFLDVNQYDKYLKVGENEIAIKVNNQQNYLASPKIKTTYTKVVKSGFGALKKPVLYGIVIGTSNYRGEKLDLQFADKDAERFYDALKQTGSALFGNNNTRLYLLNTNEENRIASKENIKLQFEDLATTASPDDAIVVYFSGHGVNFKTDNEDQFYYLTKDVESGDLQDEVIRENYAISTAEITNWIKNIPAEKQVLIMDACASGKVIEDIMIGTKAVTSSQIRAIERMKDRTGMFVLAGSASDQVSYEASQFGQSLLTYSLLAGIKGQALRDDEFVDVVNLFEYSVDQVPELATYIGGVQKPIIAIPYGGSSFDIGRIDETINIDLPQIKPIFIRSNFQDEFEFADVLGLSTAVDSELRNFSTKGANTELIFVDVNKYPKAYSIKGRYTIEDESVSVLARVFKDKAPIGTFEIKGSKNDVKSLVAQIMESAYLKIKE